MGTLAVESTRRIYFEHQQRGPLTVVLSHGWGMGGRAWDNVVAALNDEGFSTLVVDHRCCGASDKDFVDVSIAALGADVVALCDHLSLRSVVLNGWSLGGAVVVEAAQRLEGRLKGLVLTAAATPRYTRAADFPYGGTPDDVAGTVKALRADRVNFLHGLYHGGVFAREVSVQVKDWCERIALQASSGADASLGALAQLDQRDALRAIKVPALCFVGGKDGVVSPDICRAAAKMLPKGTALEMAECGHAPFLEDAPTYHNELLRFLKSL